MPIRFSHIIFCGFGSIEIDEEADFAFACLLVGFRLVNEIDRAEGDFPCYIDLLLV